MARYFLEKAGFGHRKKSAAEKKRRLAKLPEPAILLKSAALAPKRTLRPTYAPKATAETGYKPMSDDYCELVYKLALLGADNAQIADVLGVSPYVFAHWIEDPKRAVGSAIRRGRLVADAEIANSLYNRGKGYSHPDTHFCTVRNPDGTSEVVATPTVKYYPPDTTACIFWLKNRQRESWRDIYRSEVTGKDGRPIKVVRQLDLSKLSNKELEMAEQLGIKLGNAAVDREINPMVMRGSKSVQ